MLRSASAADGAGGSTSSLSPHAKPAPNPFTEQRINEELRGIDRLLEIRWHPNAIEGPHGLEGRYALVCHWRENDPRWTLYYKGEIGEHFDVLGWFCEDIHNAHSTPKEPESVLRLLVDLLGRCDNTRESWKVRMKKAAEANIAQRRKIVAEAADMAGQEAASYYYRSSKAKMVSMYSGGKD